RNNIKEMRACSEKYIFVLRDAPKKIIDLEKLYAIYNKLFYSKFEEYKFQYGPTLAKEKACHETLEELSKKYKFKYDRIEEKKDGKRYYCLYFR
ncbi:MAG: hypothetical protein NZM26_05640, partial [Patescibacteria group bacterium]|nr:hypothetical protein [Patescibacteria group bacterium]